MVTVVCLRGYIKVKNDTDCFDCSCIMYSCCCYEIKFDLIDTIGLYYGLNVLAKRDYFSMIGLLYSYTICY